MKTLPAKEIEKFKAGILGEVLLHGDKGYDNARIIWNGMFNRKPAIIARCNGTDDVLTAVHFARDKDLLTAVKGGGPNSAGNAVCDDGIMIEM